jgi:hypothetical protein
MATERRVSVVRFVSRTLWVVVLGAVLPAAASAQNVCNGLVNLNYVSGPMYAVAGDIYRVEVALGAGTITGGALNRLTADRWRFMLDCQNVPFVGCTNEGDIIRYVGDGTITDTGCLDAGGFGVTWTTNGVDGPLGPNEVVFTPSSPVVIPANTLPAAGCRVEFDIRVQTSPGVDASPLVVQEAAGYRLLGVPPFDANCDNGLSSTSGQTGEIRLCPQCADGECFDQACNQNTGLCEQTDEPASTPCGDVDGNVCTVAGCDGAGSCDQNHIFTPDSTPCPDTDGDQCTDAGCDGNGTCDQNHQVTTCPPPADLSCDFGQICNPANGLCEDNFVPGSTPCPDTDNNVCTVAGCDGLGACDQGHVSTPASTPCPDTDNSVCTVAGCDGNGTCNQGHVIVGDSTPCPDTDNDQCTTAGCEAGTCVQTHQVVSCDPADTECSNPDTCNPANGQCQPNDEPDSTPCGDTDGNECTTAGCENAVCVQTHVLDPDSTPCTDTDGNVCTTAGCENTVCVQTHVVNEGQPCLGNGVCNPFGDCIVTPPDEDHYKCYKARAPFNSRPVTLADQFTTSTATVRRVDRFCNPVNKNNEGIDDPTAHLSCYRIREAPLAQRVDVVMTNQFGEQHLSLRRPRNLCVPAEKDLVESELNIPHFKCYRATKTRGAPYYTQVSGVSLDDQFEERFTTLIRPVLVCTPVDKNGEDPGAPQAPGHLTCFKVKDDPGQPRFVPQTVDYSDQFVAQDLMTSQRTDCGRSRLLCVPSTKRIASPSGAFVELAPGLLD